MAITMRLCAGCNRVMDGYVSVNPDDPYFCPKCWQKMASRSQDLRPRDRVRHVDKLSGPFSDLLVISVEDGLATVQPLGFPDMRRTEPVGALVKYFK